MKRAFSPFILLLWLAFIIPHSQAQTDFVQALEPIRLIPGAASVQQLQLDDAGTRLAITYADNSAALYSFETAEKIILVAAVLSPTGIIASADETSITYADNPFIETPNPVRRLLLNPQNTRLAVASEAHTIEIYDAQDSTLLDTLEAANTTLLFNPAGDVLALDNPRLNQIILWQENGAKIVLPGQMPLQFSPDGQFMALVNDATTLTLRRMDDVLAQQEEIVWGSLSAHYAAITAMAFSPDSQTIATASLDGSISLWDVTRKQEINILSGHLAGVHALAFSPDGSLLVSGDADGRLHVWDVATGQFLRQLSGTGAALTAIAFVGEAIITGGTDGTVLVWGSGAAIPLPVVTLPATTYTPLPIEQGIHGNARRAMTAGTHPLHPVGCYIAKDERVLAIGRSAEGGLLLFTPGCEGAVWTSLGTRYFNWQDRSALQTLPLVAPETASTPRRRIPDYATVCANAQTQRTLSADVMPIMPALYPPDALPSAAQATVTSDTVTVICHDYSTRPIENCHYFGAYRRSYIFTRQRVNDTIRLVDYASGQVIAQHIFEGDAPPPCPEHVTRGTVNGAVPAPDIWVTWVLQNTGYEHLLPLGNGTQSVAIFDAPASGASNSRILGLMEFHPLGRFAIPADYLVRSPDGVYVASLQQQATSVLLSLWDLRGGQPLWQVSLPERQWETVQFSPDGNTLLVKTNAPYPAPEEIRFTFYDALTGTIISETGDVDILDSPVIPGNMPQQLTANPRYTQAGQIVVVDYGRRAEVPRCAVWQVSTAALVWQMENRCGTLSADGRYMLLARPYTEIFSAYSQLVVYEVASGAVLTTSQDEVVQSTWLTNEWVFIERPYGEAPMIWNILDNTTALVELPVLMGSFLPEVLNRVMFYAYGDTTYVWDIATGELLGTTSLQGRIVEQANRVLILQECQPEDSDTSALCAVNLENNELVWEIEWTHAWISIRDEGSYLFAYNHQTQQVDIFDLQTGTKTSSIPLDEHDFTLTADWQWLIQPTDYNRFIIWGLPQALDLFTDPPHIRITADTDAYYEPNTRFPYNGLSH
jgi:WD40 repeat protein